MKNIDKETLKIMINETMNEIKDEKKKKKEEKKKKKETVEKNGVLFSYHLERKESLKNLKPVKIDEEDISTCVDCWKEYIIKSPLISIESVIVLLPFLKQEMKEIKHFIYSNNHLIRLYFSDDTLTINKNDIALHVDNGLFKILYFDNENIEDVMKIMNFFEKKFNNSINIIKNEDVKKTRSKKLNEIKKMKFNFETKLPKNFH